MSEKHRYRLGDTAEEDLKDILEFTTRRWSAEQALKYLNGIEEAFEEIAEFPMMNRERSEFVPPVRVKHYRAHIIIYRIEGDTVLIDRILHGRRDWLAILGGESER